MDAAKVIAHCELAGSLLEQLKTELDRAKELGDPETPGFDWYENDVVHLQRTIDNIIRWHKKA